MEAFDKLPITIMGRTKRPATKYNYSNAPNTLTKQWKL